LTSALHLFYSPDGGTTFSSSAPVNAGTYEIYYTFDGNANYNAVSTRTDSGKAVVLSPADAGVKVTGYSIPYDGHSHTASGTATDVHGNALPASDFNLTATTHTGAGTSSDSWTFHDPSGNYQDAAGSVSDSIAKVTLTITANNATKLPGEPNPTFTVSYSGFVNGEGPGVLGGTLSFSLTATGSNTYAITPYGLRSSNYTITFVSGTLTVLDYSQATAHLQTGQGGVDTAGLASGLQNSLDSQLQAAIAYFLAGDTADGVSVLGAFINHVRAQLGKGIQGAALALAESWITDAQRIISAVG
jgi:hypothetical protein